MAAHGFTILREWSEGQRISPNAVEHALAYAPGCDNLDLEDWQTLRDAADNVQPVADQLIPKYAKLWTDLGMPNTAEEWAAARLIRPLQDRVPLTWLDREEVDNHGGEGLDLQTVADKFINNLLEQGYWEILEETIRSMKEEG